jgi:hypothetical protein
MKTGKTYVNRTKISMSAGGVAHMVRHLPSKPEAKFKPQGRKKKSLLEEDRKNITYVTKEKIGTLQ